jgi:hypothetical protein
MSLTYKINTTLPNNYSTVFNGATITNATTYTAPTAYFNSSNNKPIMSIPNGEDKVVLEKDATLDVKGIVRINGVNLEERLRTIERVLAIPERDAAMEAKYPSLKKKFDEYINTLEKYRTFDRLKGE